MSGAPASGPAMIFAPPLAQAMLMQVPFRRRGSHRRPGKTVVRALAKAAGRGRDVDRVKLVCDPAK